MTRRLLRAMNLDELAGRQERLLALGLAILHVGTGISYSVLALYLLRHVHLSAAAYGAGMSLAAFLGIASGPVAGYLADRFDAFRLYAVLMWTMCAGTVAIIFAAPWTALVLLCVLMVCGRGSATVMSVLVGRTIAVDRRVRYRAVVKTMSNSAMLAGLGLGALLVSDGSKRVFEVGFAVEALMFVAASVLVHLARSQATETPASAESTDRTESAASGCEDRSPAGRQRFGVLRDRRLLALTVASGVLTLPVSVPTVALPLWVSSHRHWPLWLVPLVTTISTFGVVLLQIPASRRVTDVPTSARAARKGGVLYAVAVALLPLSALTDHTVAAVVIVVTMAAVLVVGEIYSAAGTWGLVYGLAPESALGQYQGVFRLGGDVSMVAAPTLFAWLVDDASLLGWAGLAGVLLVAAVLLVPISRYEPSRGGPSSTLSGRRETWDMGGGA
ncbi:MFS transporter [Actinomadura oligospora]|uniref:MFS transporter n=1 Tax=Actinomadura oligospora TaxID=111804 RepID=UPI0004B6AF90|nr:MFS transporter [Actinomadura oligospora]